MYMYYFRDFYVIFAKHVGIGFHSWQMVVNFGAKMITITTIIYSSKIWILSSKITVLGATVCEMIAFYTLCQVFHPMAFNVDMMNCGCINF